MKMMPRFSARSIAAALTFSWLIRASHSCSKSTRRASATRHFAADAALGQDLLEHPLEVEVHLLQAHPGEHHRRGASARCASLHPPVVHLAGGASPASSPASAGSARANRGCRGGVEGGRGGSQKVQQPLLGPAAGLLARPAPAPAAGPGRWRSRPTRGPCSRRRGRSSRPRCTGGLDLDERGAGQPGQPAGDLGLPHAGRPDHEDVLRGHFLPHVLGKLLPPPAVADGHGHRPLRVVLADDVAVQLGNDFTRGQVWHASSSTTMFVFV